MKNENETHPLNSKIEETLSKMIDKLSGLFEQQQINERDDLYIANVLHNTLYLAMQRQYSNMRRGECRLGEVQPINPVGVETKMSTESELKKTETSSEAPSRSQNPHNSEDADLRTLILTVRDMLHFSFPTSPQE